MARKFVSYKGLAWYIRKLLPYKAGLIMVSSDFAELTEMCDRILVIKQGNLIANVLAKTKIKNRCFLKTYFSQSIFINPLSSLTFETSGYNMYII